MGKVKTLILDIETFPTEAYVWGLFDQNIALNQIKNPGGVMCWAAKWAGEKDTWFSSINMTSRKEMLEAIWEMLDEADEVVGWNCLEISTPVLKQDLTWVPVGELKEGDAIVGFDEGNPPGTVRRNSSGKWNGVKNRRGRNIVPATVTSNFIKDAECVEVRLSNGDKIITTLDHAWLSMGPKDNNHQWRISSQLKPGYRVVKLLTPWKKDESFESGWLSGFLDGEGSFFQKKKNFNLSCYQADGVVWERALQYFKKLNIPLNSFYKKKKTNKMINSARIGSGKWGSIEALGKICPSRFKVDWEQFGTITGKDMEAVEVVEVLPVGIKKIAVLSTSSKTFIGGGYAMHNCDSFDIKLLNGEFAQHGMTPPSPYKKVDLMKVVKNNMKFISHKLDFISQTFGIGKKTHHDGFPLWVSCMKGDKKAWVLMEEYNVNDVELTEKMYFKLIPWISSGVNRSTLANDFICPNCSSKKVQRRGVSITSTGTRQRYQCSDCGTWCSGEKIVMPKVNTLKKAK